MPFPIEQYTEEQLHPHDGTQKYIIENSLLGSYPLQHKFLSLFLFSIQQPTGENSNKYDGIHSTWFRKLLHDVKIINYVQKI